MNIFEYVKKIKKSISKNNVLDDINVTREEMTNTTMDFLNKNIGWLTKNERDLQSQAYVVNAQRVECHRCVTWYLSPDFLVDVFFVICFCCDSL